MIRGLGWSLFLILFTACSFGASPAAPGAPASSPAQPDLTPSPLPLITHQSEILTPTELPTSTEASQAAQTPSEMEPASGPATKPSPTARPTLGPQDWQSVPVVPQLSPRLVEIYQQGQLLGLNPRAFSKIGDCESTPTWFLGDFDLSSQVYNLGEYQSLQPVIDYFQGSFGRTSLAARRGYTATSALTPLWADRKLCEKNETPLACEYRLHRPMLAFIMLGTNDVFHQDTFDTQMRQIIEYTINQGIIPVLATKADNLEGDGSINATIARLAWEYDIPLWNFWLAVQPLPNHGLQEDGSHLTWAQNLFDVPSALKQAWPVRNLTALQVLDAVWRAADAAP